MMPTIQISNEVQAWLNARQDAMTGFITELARMESPSSDREALLEILTWLEQHFAALGMHTIHVPGKKSGGYLYARPKGKSPDQPLQLLIGHCDTVWPLHTLREMPLNRTEERLSGPGVYDMKAGITQIFFALQCLSDLGMHPGVLPVVLINSDEEVGSRESTEAIRRLARIADRAFVLEPPLGLDGKLKTARKGLGRFTLTVHGKAAHAGLDPEKGANAIVEMARERGWKLVFNLMAENMEKGGELVGEDLIFLMNENRKLLKERYGSRGVLVVDNLDAVEDAQFIDRDWTTEHYAEQGRKTIARRVAEELQRWYGDQYQDAGY